MLRLKLNFPCFECIFFLLCILAVLLKLFFSVFRSRNQKKSPADEERREYIQGGIRVDFGGKGMKKIHRKGSNNSNFKFLSPLQASIFSEIFNPFPEEERETGASPFAAGNVRVGETLEKKQEQQCTALRIGAFRLSPFGVV